MVVAEPASSPATSLKLADALEMAPQALSNQLRRLADRRIVTSRRDGDPCVAGLLDLGLCLLEETAPAIAGSR